MLVTVLVASAGASAQSVTDRGGEPTAAQPYVTIADRPIRALDQQRVDDLLAGRGAGYALAAELNHYPGPAHTLELADQLGIAPDRRKAVTAIRQSMADDARTFGEQIVALEAELDRGFASGAITREQMAELTGEIAALDGQLRAVHLAAHLETARVLAVDQIAHYDELRGYQQMTTMAPSSEHTHTH
jgi:hypothetical protein